VVVGEQIGLDFDAIAKAKARLAGSSKLEPVDLVGSSNLELPENTQKTGSSNLRIPSLPSCESPLARPKRAPLPKQLRHQSPVSSCSAAFALKI